MVDVCNMSNFAAARYFSQFELEENGPAGYDYDHTRCLEISVEGSLIAGTNLINSLTPMMRDMFHTGSYPGIPRPANWENIVLNKMFPGPEFGGSLLPPGPFDFALWFRSRVAIMLVGDFWRFSSTLAPITTKHQYGDHYFDLRLHRKQGTSLVSLTVDEWHATSPDVPCRCISFFTQQPCRDSQLGSPKVTHGFSLNIEIPKFRSNGTIESILPMTIDPDVENKGGNPGP
jgi:hypothetical protein